MAALLNIFREIFQEGFVPNFLYLNVSNLKTSTYNLAAIGSKIGTDYFYQCPVICANPE
jgi:hypothetical protein